MRKLIGCAMMGATLSACTTNIAVRTLPTPPVVGNATPTNGGKASSADAATKTSSRYDSGTPAGFVYYLPKATLAASARVVLTSCGDKGEDEDKDEGKDKGKVEGKGNDESFVFAPKFQLAATVTTNLTKGSDGTPVVIDYRQLAAFLRTGTVGIERHPNGMLKSVNASIEDQTPDTLATLAAAGGTAYLLAVAPPVGLLVAGAAVQAKSKDLSDKGKNSALGGFLLLPPPKKISVIRCTQATLNAIEARNDAIKARDEATSALEEKTQYLNNLIAGPVQEGVPEEIRRTQGELAKISRQITDATASIAAAKKLLEFVYDINDPNLFYQ